MMIGPAPMIRMLSMSVRFGMRRKRSEQGGGEAGRSSRLRFARSKRHSSNTVAQHRCVKVQDQAFLDSRQFQVGQELCLVNWNQALDRFHLHDQLICDNQVYSIAAF